MMSKQFVPAWAMAAAQKVADWEAQVFEGGASYATGTVQGIAMRIEEAMLPVIEAERREAVDAERERCACLAETWRSRPEFVDTEKDSETPRPDIDAIASVIRSGTAA